MIELLLYLIFQYKSDRPMPKCKHEMPYGHKVECERTLNHVTPWHGCIRNGRAYRWYSM